LEQAILQAAWAEILRVGFAATTMDGIAARAGTSKPVLYRRWPSRTDLLVAAVDAAVPELTTLPDPPVAAATNADPRAALIAVLADLRDRYAALTATPGLDDAALAAVRRRTHAAGLERVATVMDDVTPPELVRLLVDAVHARATIGETLTGADLVALIDNVVLPLLRRPQERHPPHTSERAPTAPPTQ
jgi:AcrR family transcriptional regulator